MRTELLKEQIIRTPPSISTKRAEIVTDYYKKTEKIDHSAIPNGTLLNIKLNPMLLTGEKGIKSLVTSFFGMKAQRVLYNNQRYTTKGYYPQNSRQFLVFFCFV